MAISPAATPAAGRGSSMHEAAGADSDPGRPCPAGRAGRSLHRLSPTVRKGRRRRFPTAASASAIFRVMRRSFSPCGLILGAGVWVTEEA